MLLTGTFCRAVDEKLRVAIPKRLREAMACPLGGVLFVAPSTDRSLAIYPEEAFERLADRLAQAPPTGQEVRAFSRLFYARARAVEIDSQGRIRIPGDLVELAAMGKEVVLLGVQDHLEVWAAERWNEYLQQKLPGYDKSAEMAFGHLNRPETREG